MLTSSIDGSADRAMAISSSRSEDDAAPERGATQESEAKMDFVSDRETSNQGAALDDTAVAEGGVGGVIVRPIAAAHGNADDDPILRLFDQWRSTKAVDLEAYHRWQDLEEKNLAEIGVLPRIDRKACPELDALGRAEGSLISLHDIQEFYKSTPLIAPGTYNLAQLAAAHRKRVRWWYQQNRRIEARRDAAGLTAAAEESERLGDIRYALEAQLRDMPPRSLAGLRAKLALSIDFIHRDHDNDKNELQEDRLSPAEEMLVVIAADADRIAAESAPAENGGGSVRSPAERQNLFAQWLIEARDLKRRANETPNTDAGDDETDQLTGQYVDITRRAAETAATRPAEIAAKLKILADQLETIQESVPTDDRYLLLLRSTIRDIGRWEANQACERL